MSFESARLVPEVKEKWLAALRSGEYEQGTSCLYSTTRESTNPQYCCLGVLCDLAVKEGIAEWVIRSPKMYDDNKVPYHCQPVDRRKTIGHPGDSATVLPDAIVRWAFQRGFRNDASNPIVDVGSRYGESLYVKLSMFNDGHPGIDRRTFDQIADIIEEKL